MGPTQLESQFFRRINLPTRMGRNLCQRVETITAKKGKRHASMEGKPARENRTHTWTSRLWWGVDVAKNLRGSILLLPLLRSRVVGRLTVREHGRLSYRL